MTMSISTDEKWKPIDQCQKMDDVYYNIRFKDGTFGAATYIKNENTDNWYISDGDGFILASEEDMSHFAEMPEFGVK